MFVAESSGLYRWPLVRIRAGGETEVVLLSEKWLPLTVHWAKRSLLCAHDKCPLCSWLPARGLYYAAVSFGSRASMLELGALSSSLIEQHCGLLHQGMRPGLRLRLWRSSQKAPVHGEVVGVIEDAKAIDARELAIRVMALYQMPGPNPCEEWDAWQERLCLLARRRAEVAVREIEGRAMGDAVRLAEKVKRSAS